MVSLMCLYDFVVFLSQIIDLSLNFEGIVQLKMKSMSLFNRPHVIPNMYDLLSSVEYIRRHFLCLNVFFIQWNVTVWLSTFFKTSYPFVFRRRKKVTCNR